VLHSPPRLRNVSVRTQEKNPFRTIAGTATFHPPGAV